MDGSSNLHKGDETVTDPDLIVKGREGALNKGGKYKCYRLKKIFVSSDRMF